jgi:hypothetical protein
MSRVGRIDRIKEIDGVDKVSRIIRAICCCKAVSHASSPLLHSAQTFVI